MNYIWIILLAIYIISPFDAHPLFLDDLIAAAVMFYLLYKRSRQRQKQYEAYSGSAGRSTGRTAEESHGPLTLGDAYKMLGIGQSASMEEINRAYREKMIKSHPDKVNHLSEELQEKAKEITLKLNEAYDLIKKQRKN